MTTPPPRRPGRTAHLSGWWRGLLAGAVLASSIGSCELPKPQLPSIGSAPPGPAPAAAPRV